MKRIVAIILMCLPTELSAAERCTNSRLNRDEVARVASAKPPISRIEYVRPQRVRPSTAWRLLLFDQQIL